MNTKNTIITLLASATLFFVGCGHKHDHDHADHSEQDSSEHAESSKKVPGPNGGRLITSTSPAVEFYLLENNRAQLTFVDENNKPVAPSGQSASAVAGDRMSPTQVKFESNGSALVSVDPLPKIEGQPLVLTLLASADATPSVEKFNLKTYTCSGCDLSEYACTCGH